MERHKREKAYYNVVFSQNELKTLMATSWWYDLFIPPGYLDFRLDRLALWQEIVTHLLKGYLDRFYNFHKAEFEAPYLEYQVLRPHDELVLEGIPVPLLKNRKRNLSSGYETSVKSSNKVNMKN